MSIRNDDASELAGLARLEAERQERLLASERFDDSVPIAQTRAVDAVCGVPVGSGSPLQARHDRLRERIRTLATQLDNAYHYTAATWIRELLEER